MKVAYVFLSVFASSLIACQSNDAEPSGLSGEWFLVKKQVQTSSTVVTERIALSPLQEIAFSYPYTFKNNILQDTLLTGASFFKVQNGDLIGPSLILQNGVTGPVLSHFAYTIYQDTLTLTVIGGRYSLRMASRIAIL